MKNKQKIDHRKKLSIEDQFRNGLRNFLVAQKHAQNLLIPTPVLMAELLGVENEVAKLVYDEFIQLNLIEVKDDLYYKVEPYRVIYENETQDVSLTKLAKKMGLESHFEILSREWVVQFDLLDIDDLYLKGRYLKVRRLNYFDDEKEAILIAYIHESLINDEVLKNIESNGFANIMDALIKNKKYHRRRVLSIIEASLDVYENLDLDKGMPIIFSHQTVEDEKNALLFYLDFYTAHEAFLTLEKIDLEPLRASIN